MRTELAELRTELAQQRTGLSEKRTDLAVDRTDLAVERNDLAEIRTELARERTRAAEERTLMAWVRTSLSMLSFGFGIDRFFKYMDRTKTGIGVDAITEERVLGLSLMSLGIFALGAAVIGHWRALKNIETQEYKYVPGWSQGLTVAIVLLFVGLAAFFPLVVSGLDMSEVFTLNSKVLQTLSTITIFTIMIAMGVHTPIDNLKALWLQPGLPVRALLSALVLFSVGTALIGYLLHVQPATGAGLALLAAAPGAPLLTRRVTMAGGNVAVASSFQVTLATLAVVTTPLTLLIFAAIFSQVQESGDFLVIARQVVKAQFLPLGIGLLVRKIAGAEVEDVGNLLGTIVNTLFVVLVVFMLGISFYLVPTVNPRGLLAIALIVAFGLTCGHFLGGPDFATRSSIAVGTIARNAGLALFLAAANGAGQAIPTIISYMIVGFVVGVPYNVWVKKQMKQAGEVVVEPVSAVAVS
ncbi:MAG: DUF202 domain-containing protein [Oscillatoriales cyanobacterium RM1_1_9]|nr:DUF202 domain-containing protein [Oscillatoriales cyanobacterium SM2_3_0]NJO47116.1 DUF202 domain-containing protein [Oscillatoriales cyanobacterium RM2_1_1]NJO72281.1 DUF202 domain-containing protein [Oscillatoriales cyanobacterium RM1_1_9]